ncbi:MAG: glycosyltransferase family 2 protein [Gammaproteobacteria bacterium]|nr:glycosyltransferase family 2 protein [Gammaproteobacteria bacterium]MBU1600575.1 glycosyltransferase family 2 protein [Gammaproteobacteria bacterium]MBU2435031.1 glycosyltransferase family 2 protein [Gammaproteobacteria bacterium]MBU2448267.1 glycosyltransferase family 2 protein [Gammaproteobacteria bacterium]
MPLRLISIVVTTYNRPDSLQAVLASLAAQTDTAFEVLVADDGSRQETAAAVAEAAVSFPVPLVHLWQSDEGFRAAAARNLAVAASRGDYLVFVDGDCVLRPDFVARHRALAEPAWFVAGNRVLLSESFTKKVLESPMTELHGDSRLSWLGRRFFGAINRWFPLCFVPGDGWRKRQPQRWQGARTCNLAMWRSDFDAINGFDEAFQGWGHEDADLAIRLLHAGVQRKDGRFATAVLHLWHRENDRSNLAENERRLAEILAADRRRAEVGIDTYNPERVSAATIQKLGKISG